MYTLHPWITTEHPCFFGIATFHSSSFLLNSMYPLDISMSGCLLFVEVVPKVIANSKFSSLLLFVRRAVRRSQRVYKAGESYRRCSSARLASAVRTTSLNSLSFHSSSLKMFTRFVTPFVALLFLIASFAAALPWAQPPASTKVVTVTHIVTASPTTPTEPADSPGGTCNAGKTAQCCDSVHQVSLFPYDQE